jgi:hypothetical protein
VGPTQAERAALFWNETAAWGTLYLTPFQSRVALRFGTTQMGNQILYNRPASVAAAYTITTAIKNGTTDALFVNGAQVPTGQANKLAAIAGCQSVGNLARGYNNTFFAGDIAEVIVYTRALSSAERQQIEQYLFNKYDLTPAPAPVSVASVASSLQPALELELNEAHDALRLKLTGRAGMTYQLERSTDLITWTPAATITLPLDGLAVWTNTVTSAETAVFFRANAE